MRLILLLVPVCVLVSFLHGCGVATTGDIRGAYVRQAKTEDRIDQLEKQIEALKFQIRDMGSAQYDDMTLRRLESRIDALARSLRKLERQVGSAPQSPPPPSTAFRPFVPRPTPAPPELATRPVAPTADSFDQAYRELSKGKYASARTLFMQFAEENPGAVRTTDARYWIAESYYRETRHEEAILGFQTFIDSYPRDRRVPLAYLKQGLSLIEINRNEEAKLFLQTLIDKYPMSEETRIAKEKLRDLALESQ